MNNWKVLAAFSFAMITFPVNAIEFERVTISVPASLQRDLLRFSLARTLYWTGPNQVLYVDYGSNVDGTPIIFDVRTGEIVDTFALGQWRGVSRVDRREGLLEIRSLNAPTEYRHYRRDPADLDPPFACDLRYGFRPVPRGGSTVQLSRVLPDGTVIEGQPRLATDALNGLTGGLHPVASFHFADCPPTSSLALVLSRGHTGPLYVAQVADLQFTDFRQVAAESFGWVGAFYREDAIITFTRNEDLIPQFEDEPFTYYPVLVDLDGEVIAEDRSIEIMQGSKPLDYDPSLRRIVVVQNLIDPDHPYAAEIAVYRIVE